MRVTQSMLLLVAGALAGVAFVLSCGDNMKASARADAAIDAPKLPDAAPTCDCPAAEPPLAGRFTVVSNTVVIVANGSNGTSAACPVGSQLITGSCTQDLNNPIRNLTLQQSGFFENTPREWHCEFRNNEPFSVTIRVSVICLNPAA